jgi:hypothetical protein
MMFHVEHQDSSAGSYSGEVSRETKPEVLTSRPRDARIGDVPWRLGFPA